MANAYKYTDLVDDIANPQIENAIYCRINDLEETPLRVTDVLIQPSESKFSPYMPEVKKHTVTLCYPTTMTITYAGQQLSYQISGGMKKSAISVPEKQDGYNYYPLISYTPKDKTNLSSNNLGSIQLENITRDTTLTIRYRYDYKLSSNNIRSFDIDDSTSVNASYSYTYTSTKKKVKVLAYPESGYAISAVNCTYCKAVSTGQENEYEIEYTGSNGQTANVNFVTKAKQADTTYHNVYVSGLQTASVTYNSKPLDEIGGVASISNVANGSTVELTIDSNTNYTLSKITINNVSTDYSDINSKAISLAVNGADSTINVETTLKTTMLKIPQNSFITSIVVNGETITPTTDKTVSVSANAQSSITFNFDSTLYKLTAVSVSSGTITKQSGTTYVLSTNSTAENITLNYTLAKIEKNTITFQNAANVIVKKGTAAVNTLSGAYSEQLTSGSTVIYTIVPNSGYTLNSVTITPTKSQYSYFNGTLTISSIADDVTINISTAKQQEVPQVVVKVVNTDHNVTDVTIGTDSNNISFNSSTMEQTLSSDTIDAFFNASQPMTITIESGKVIKSVSCSDGGAIYGNAKDGYSFKLTNKSTKTITITIVTADSTDTPTETETYNIQVKGANQAYVSDIDGHDYDIIGFGGDTIYTFHGFTDGSTASLKALLADTEKYEVYSVPTAQGYVINWNSSTGTLTIPNVTSNVEIQLYIRKKQAIDDWDGSATFYQENSEFTTTLRWDRTDSGYEYSKTLSGSVLFGITTAWWICFNYEKGCKYLIKTDYTNISKIYIYSAENSLTASTVGQAINQRIELDSTQFKKVDNGYEIPMKYIPQGNYECIYFAFYRQESSTEPLVISDVKFAYDNIGTSSAFSANGVYRSDVISNFQYITECDPTAQNVPYSSLSFEVYDENNMFTLANYNQADSADTSYNKYVKGTPYNIYALAAEVTNDTELSDRSFYIVQIGRVFLDNITHNNDCTTFEFIGVLEKYDNIFLSSTEKRLSKYFLKTNVREYVKKLFGSDVDVTGIPEYFTSLTPFESESKTEILKTICDYCNLTMFENASGKIAFSTDVLSNTPTIYDEMSAPYELSLNNCLNFPTYEQATLPYDSAEVQITKRVKEKAAKIYDKADLAIYVKTIEPSEGEDWQADNDWQLALKQSRDTIYYYDANGQEYVISSSSSSDENVELTSILLSFGDIKYIKFETDFQNPATDLKFYSNPIIEEGAEVQGLDVETFREYLCGRIRSFFFDWLNAGTADGVEFYVSEKKIELFAKFPISKNPNYGTTSANRYIINYGYIDVFSSNSIQLSKPSETLAKYSGSSAPTTINYAEILLDMLLSVSFTIDNTVAREITTSTRTFLYKPYQTSKNILKISNDLVSSYSDALWYSHMAFQKASNNSVDVVIEDWRGNGLIELSNNILFEHSTGREEKRTYDKFYCGKVKKNIYNFDGALSVDTTLAISPTAYYYSSTTKGDNVSIFPSSSTTFTNGKVDFNKKIT